VISTGVNWILIGPPASPSDDHPKIEFNYGPVPFVENFRDTFQPGAMANIGIEVHMDASRIADAHIDVYDHDWPVDSTSTRIFYSSDFNIQGVAPTYVQFEIPTNVTTGTWAYFIRIADSSFEATVNATFQIASMQTPTSVDFPTPESLPYSTLDVESTRYAFFENPNASVVVLYVGGGTIGKIGGPTPIDGYSDVSNQNSATYRLVYDLFVHGFSVITPLEEWRGLDFPSEIIGYLRTSGVQRFYGIGHSAGGFVIAHSIINYPDLFEKAVLADAPLTRESTGFYFTELSILSENAKAEHLLVWGLGDNQASLENAYAWMDHANQTLATLRVYDYGHDWAGTTAETQVRQQILDFLRDEPPLRAAPSEHRSEITASNLLSKQLLPSELIPESPDFDGLREMTSQTRFGSALSRSLDSLLRESGFWTKLATTNGLAQSVFKLALYALNPIIEAGVWTYSMFPGETGAILAVVEMSFLASAVYLGLPIAILLPHRPRVGRLISGLAKPSSAFLIVLLITAVVLSRSELQSPLVYVSLALVLTAFLTAVTCSSALLLTVSERLRATS
jgi:hypothetical protein